MKNEKIIIIIIIKQNIYKYDIILVILIIK